MEQKERGVIHNEGRAKQLILFDGLEYGNISPTDMDGVIDYRNKFWIIYEAKCTGAPFPTGQRLTMEHFIDMADDAKRYGIALVADHNVADVTKSVSLMACKVRWIYTTEEKKWREPETEMTVKEISDKYYELYKNAPSIPLYFKVSCFYKNFLKEIRK